MEMFGANIRLRRKANRTLGRIDTRYRPEKNGGTWFLPLQYVKALTGQGGHDVINDYLEVPEVNYIINLRARMFSNVDIRLESKVTGLEVNNQQSLARILRTPNWYQ